MGSPLVRGGLTIGVGILTGNVLGFVRVALSAYLLGTRSMADSLAVVVGPIDTLNSVLINSMVFAFVPMLTERTGPARTALFLKLARCFTWLFSAVAVTIILTAPWIMRLLAPGLDPHFYPISVNLLRIASLSTMAAGISAVHGALLYTDRRFAPSAFYQASLNVFTVACALAFWNWLGVYGFAIGYAAGAWVQCLFVIFTSRAGLNVKDLPACETGWLEILKKPMFFLVYAGGLALNVTFTRAWATHAGPGLAAAMDYCMRGVTVPLSLLVNPMSNSLLPEIARLRSMQRLQQAYRLIDKTIALAGLMVVAGCSFALAFRRPAVELLFQRGSFTAHSTDLVSAVFLGLGPCLIGWTLIEITSRSLFALDRPTLPVIAAVLPVLVNVALTLSIQASGPQSLGLGASVGALCGFLLLFAMVHTHRRRTLEAA